MSRKSLYPHVPRSKQPLFPHVPKGQKVEYLPQTEKTKYFWVEKNLPYDTWAIVEAWPGGTVRSPLNTVVEAIKRESEIGAAYGWNLKQVPSPQEMFPKQHEALKKLYPYEFVEYHDDGDLTIQLLVPKPKPRVGFNKGDVMVVTTDGQTFKEEKLPTPEKLYQRAADGYPIGADKIMRDAWGPIPNPDQPFWSGKGFIKPVKIYGWGWSPDYNCWRAYVKFPDGTETWTSPRDLRLPQVSIEKLPQIRIEDIPSEYRHLVGWVREPLPKEAE